MAATAFSEYGVLGVQFVPWRKGWFLFAVCADAHITGCNALNGAIVVKEHL